MTDVQTIVIWTWVFGRNFPKKNAVTVRKTLIVLIDNDKIQTLQQKRESGKLCTPNVRMAASQSLMACLRR